MNIRCIELYSSLDERQYFLRRQEPVVSEDVTMITLSNSTRRLKAWKWIDLKHSRQDLYHAMDFVCARLEANGSEDMLLVSNAFALLLR